MAGTPADAYSSGITCIGHITLAITATVVAVALRLNAAGCGSYRQCPQHRAAPLLLDVGWKHVLSHTVRSRLHWIIIPGTWTIAGTYDDSSLTTTFSSVLHLSILCFLHKFHSVAK